MSGGHFSYEQHKISYIADDIEQEVIKSGKPIPEMLQDQWHREHPEDAVNYEWPENVIRKMEEAVYALRRALIYAQRIDYLISGDDGIDNFIRRLEKELEELDGKSEIGDNEVKYIPIDQSKNPYEEN